MPYIEKLKRDSFKNDIGSLAEKIQNKGDLNYVICELVGQLILKTRIGYTQISEWIDAVNGAERELTRRILDPYEDIKKNDNEDVPSFIDILSSINTT